MFNGTVICYSVGKNNDADIGHTCDKDSACCFDSQCMFNDNVICYSVGKNNDADSGHTCDKDSGC